jgi:hypothetical protein
LENKVAIEGGASGGVPPLFIFLIYGLAHPFPITAN